MSGSARPDPIQWEEASLWLAKAADDLSVARVLLREDFVTPASFHAQQALEKILKGLLVAAAQDVRRTHDVDDLALEANRFWPDLIPSPFPLAEVHRWYFSGRYPDVEDVPPTIGEVEDAVRQIDTIMTAITSWMAS